MLFNAQYYKFAKSDSSADNGLVPDRRNRPAGYRIQSAGGTPMNNRVYIFDTTLRDGEQSPGCSMTVAEKLRMARKLVELGVDILEAGFPIASEGDFEAVDAISREFPEVQVAALARACTLDVERAARALENARNAAHPHLHRNQRYPSEVQAARSRASRCWTKPWRRSNWRAATWTTWSFRPRTPPAPTRTTWSRSRKAVVAAGARTVNLPGHGGLLDAGRARRADRPHGAGAGRHRHRQRALPRRSGPGRRPTRWPPCRPGARQVECTINGIGERAGNCSLEEVVMTIKIRQDRLPYRRRHHHRASVPGQPAADRADHLRPAAEQGHRGRATPSRTKPASTRTAS